MMNFRLVVLVLGLSLTIFGCEKKKYCIYRRFDLRFVYLLKHISKESTYFKLEYDYSNPKNVFWTLNSQKKLDSMISIEGYRYGDTSFSQADNGYAYRVDGDCQYCDYYKSLYVYNVCEHHEE